MLEQLTESESVIEAIEEKIDDLQRRQVERMRADERIDNKLVDQVQQGSETDTAKKREATTRTGFVEILVKEDGTREETFRSTELDEES